MRFIFFVASILLFFSSQSLARNTSTNNHRIVLPESYETLKRQQQEEDRLIPDRAKDAQSAGTFISTVVDFHLQKYLKKHPSSQLHRVKRFEKDINDSTKIESDNFKIQPRLNVTQMQAQFHIESYINSKVWLENGFRTFNAQVEVYKLQQGLVAIEYRSDNTESKTTLGYRQNW